ncbi:hypothetical protein VOLCADRAFT_100534 [Volvox carteri f. nagariensis]|uniref:Uncharacterized protein n=1 Tax=Volvox carteri f. nagariensis TaxID=3068 RepID=D8UKE8_VOLCA|nr:uncharacterized protein VOLCADRAFT_100534 [Volvox carteri f. nagariensis]EFJ39801.1 hypothetical protein VOLCADRAFT_100534 [Volvox carteri f. nagariensis]|eukprot:XP_002959137.1 hypothetical protein VOLCADRAFT_100534 [Volvox carteri f. nagariensis]
MQSQADLRRMSRTEYAAVAATTTTGDAKAAAVSDRRHRDRGADGASSPPPQQTRRRVGVREAPEESPDDHTTSHRTAISSSSTSGSSTYGSSNIRSSSGSSYITTDTTSISSASTMETKAEAATNGGSQRQQPGVPDAVPAAAAKAEAKSLAASGSGGAPVTEVSDVIMICSSSSSEGVEEVERRMAKEKRLPIRGARAAAAAATTAAGAATRGGKRRGRRSGGDTAGVATAGDGGHAPARSVLPYRPLTDTGMGVLYDNPRACVPLPEQHVREWFPGAFYRGDIARTSGGTHTHTDIDTDSHGDVESSDGDATEGKGGRQLRSGGGGGSCHRSSRQREARAGGISLKRPRRVWLGSPKRLHLSIELVGRDGRDPRYNRVRGPHEATIKTSRGLEPYSLMLDRRVREELSGCRLLGYGGQPGPEPARRSRWKPRAAGVRLFVQPESSEEAVAEALRDAEEEERGKEGGVLKRRQGKRTRQESGSEDEEMQDEVEDGEEEEDDREGRGRRPGLKPCSDRTGPAAAKAQVETFPASASALPSHGPRGPPAHRGRRALTKVESVVSPAPEPEDKETKKEHKEEKQQQKNVDHQGGKAAINLLAAPPLPPLPPVKRPVGRPRKHPKKVPQAKPPPPTAAGASIPEKADRKGPATAASCLPGALNERPAPGAMSTRSGAKSAIAPMKQEHMLLDQQGSKDLCCGGGMVGGPTAAGLQQGTSPVPDGGLKTGSGRLLSQQEQQRQQQHKQRLTPDARVRGRLGRAAGHPSASLQQQWRSCGTVKLYEQSIAAAEGTDDARGGGSDGMLEAATVPSCGGDAGVVTATTTAAAPPLGPARTAAGEQVLRGPGAGHGGGSTSTSGGVERPGFLRGLEPKKAAENDGPPPPPRSDSAAHCGSGGNGRGGDGPSSAAAGTNGSCGSGGGDGGSGGNDAIACIQSERALPPGEQLSGPLAALEDCLGDMRRLLGQSVGEEQRQRPRGTTNKDDNTAAAGSGRVGGECGGAGVMVGSGSSCWPAASWLRRCTLLGGVTHGDGGGGGGGDGEGQVQGEEGDGEEVTPEAVAATACMNVVGQRFYTAKLLRVWYEGMVRMVLGIGADGACVCREGGGEVESGGKAVAEAGLRLAERQGQMLLGDARLLRRALMRAEAEALACRGLWGTGGPVGPSN